MFKVGFGYNFKLGVGAVEAPWRSMAMGVARPMGVRDLFELQ